MSEPDIAFSRQGTNFFDGFRRLRNDLTITYNNLLTGDASSFIRSKKMVALPMSFGALFKVHHAAFDADLIGIDSDHRVHVSERLLSQHDGPIPMLEAIKQLQGSALYLPGRIRDRPDRERLAMRFDRFKTAA